MCKLRRDSASRTELGGALGLHGYLSLLLLCCSPLPARGEVVAETLLPDNFVHGFANTSVSVVPSNDFSFTIEPSSSISDTESLLARVDWTPPAAWLRNVVLVSSQTSVWFLGELFQVLVEKFSWLLNTPVGSVESVAAAVAALVIAANSAIIAVGMSWRYGLLCHVPEAAQRLKRSGSGFLPRLSSRETLAPVPSPVFSAVESSQISRPASVHKRQVQAETLQQEGGEVTSYAAALSLALPLLNLLPSGLRSVVGSRKTERGRVPPVPLRVRRGASGNNGRLPLDQLDEGGVLATPKQKSVCVSQRFTTAELQSVQSELTEVPSTMVPQGSEWSLMMEQQMHGVTYVVWKKPWKNGLNAYKSTTTIHGISAQQVYSFMADDELRTKWDPNIDEFSVLEQSPENDHCELQFWRSKFPRPMAPREYLFLKQAWTGEDHAIYTISKSVRDGDTIPTPQAAGRSQRVEDYFVATKIVETTGPDGAPVSKLVQYCHEDNGVAAGMVNLTLKRGLWGFVQTQQNFDFEHMREIADKMMHSALDSTSLLLNEAKESIRRPLRRVGSNLSATMQAMEKQSSSFLPVRWLAQTPTRVANRLASGLGSLSNRFNPLRRRVGPDGKRVRKRDVAARKLRGALKRLDERKKNAYGVWESVRTRRTGGLVGAPVRLWQGMQRRRRERIELYKAQGIDLLKQLKERRAAFRRRFGMVFMPAAVVLNSLLKDRLPSKSSYG